MERFSKAVFDASNGAEKAALSVELAGVLSERLKATPDFHHGVQQLVSELRAVGHDLWNFDETDDMEVWCPNYQNPSGPGIVVTFTTDGVEVEHPQTVAESRPIAGS